MESKTDEVETATTVFFIERGFREGKALTTAQKTSALFSEEPVVMGRTLRRGSKPLRITKADYEANKNKLLQLEKAGAIKITRPKESTMQPCLKCGQTMSGGGEFTCPECGLLMTFDPSSINVPPGEPETVPAPEQTIPAPVVSEAPPAPETTPEPVPETVPEVVPSAEVKPEEPSPEVDVEKKSSKSKRK